MSEAKIAEVNVSRVFRNRLHAGNNASSKICQVEMSTVQI